MSFDMIPSIPLAILIEPLVKLLNMSDNTEYNIEDFSFFLAISRHPRLSIKNAVQILDVLGRIYVNHPNLVNLARIPMLKIMKKHSQSPIITDYMTKFLAVIVKKILKPLLSTKKLT